MLNVLANFFWIYVAHTFSNHFLLLLKFGVLTRTKCASWNFWPQRVISRSWSLVVKSLHSIQLLGKKLHSKLLPAWIMRNLWNVYKTQWWGETLGYPMKIETSSLLVSPSQTGLKSDWKTPSWPIPLYSAATTSVRGPNRKHQVTGGATTNTARNAPSGGDRGGSLGAWKTRCCGWPGFGDAGNIERFSHVRQSLGLHSPDYAPVDAIEQQNSSTKRTCVSWSR